MRDRPWGKDGPMWPRSANVRTLRKARKVYVSALKHPYGQTWSPLAMELEAVGCVYDPLRKPVLAVPRSVWNVNTVQDGQYRLMDRIRRLRDGVAHRRLCGGPTEVEDTIATGVRNLQSWVDHALDHNGQDNARKVRNVAPKLNR